MPDFQTFNLGNVLQQAEGIRGARTVNQLNQQRLDANRLLQDRASMFNPLLQEFLANPDDPNVANQLFQIDPERAEAAVGFSQGQQEQQTAEQQQDAGKILRFLQVLKKSKVPATLLKNLVPEQRQELIDQGFTEEQLNDDAFVKGDLADGLIAHFFPLADPTQFKAEDFFKVPKGDFIPFQNLTTGKIKDVRKDSPEADRLAADPNFNVVSRVQRIEEFQRTTPFGTEAQLGKLQIDINEQAAAINSFGAGAQQLLEIVGEGGANTLVAGLANVGNRLRQEIRTLVNRAGVEFEDRSIESAFNHNSYKGAFEAAGLAGESARVKNAFLALAIQRAIASGLGTGRALSDKDIENQLKTLGQNQSDPEILRLIFADDFRRLSEGVGFRAKASNLTVPQFFPPEFVSENRQTVTRDGLEIIDLRQ